jgi:flavin-dependent dehydrogenase
MDPCDVLVIGGGPAGSTVASLLSEKGWKVVLLEKDHHPRFHIGESLLPMSLPIFDRLGVLDKVEEIGIVKNGAEFASPFHVCPPVTFYFRGARDKRHPYAYQVRRSEFDHILLKNSKEKGTKVFEGVRVTGVDLNSNGMHVVTAKKENGDPQEWRARYVVDATGRDSFLAKKLGTRKNNRSHTSSAIYSHFENAERLQGDDEGNISIYWFDEGWFWMIPLKDGTMSVGAVCRSEYLKNCHQDLDKFLMKTISLSPEVSRRLQHARMTIATRATGNYSYHSNHLVGKNYILIGDAFAFIDPIFSSGVHLALTSAIHSVDVIEATLNGNPKLPGIQKEYERKSKRGLKTLSWFIYRMTQPALRNLFMAPRNVFGIEEAVLSMLAGDLYRKNTIDFPLFLFKVLYYIHFIAQWKENWQVYKRRQPKKGAGFSLSMLISGFNFKFW